MSTPRIKLSPSATVQSMLLAAVVALLVWVFAEGESLSSRTTVVTVSFPVEPTSPLIIRPEDPNFQGQVRVRLEGTTRNLETAAAIVGARVRVVPGAPGVPTEPGEKKVVDLREVIGGIPEFQGLGSTVAEVDPRQVVVNVVKMAAREVPVRVELGAGASAGGDPSLVPTLDGEPAPAQATVTLRLPEPVMATLPDGAAAIVTVSDSELRRIRGLGEGPQSVAGTVRPPVEVASSSIVLVTPETMTVTLRVKRKVETMTVASVPVWYALPPTEDGGSSSAATPPGAGGGGKWGITIERKFITGVTITGPAEELAKIKAGQLGVKAMIELSSEDLEKGATSGGVISKPATFPGLPAGVSATAADVSVAVRVSKRP